MARIHITSDIHDDYSRMSLSNYQLPIVDADVIVVAGDVAGRFSTMGRDWLEAQHHRTGLPIVVVPGNHCYWRGSLDREIDRFRDRLQVDGILVLDGDGVIIGDTRFVGGTLWTDYAIAGDVERSMSDHRTRMNDLHYIRSGTESDRPRAKPTDLLAIHERHRAGIEAILSQPFDGPTVVVTHHAPSHQSLKNGKVDDPLDGAYASDLEPVMHRYKPELWIHGHVHKRRDYVVGETRIIANPRGYVEWRRMFAVGQLDSENAQFDENLVVDVQRRPRAIPEGFEVEEGQLTLGGIPLGPVEEVLDEIEAADPQVEFEQIVHELHQKEAKRGRG